MAYREDRYRDRYGRWDEADLEFDASEAGLRRRAVARINARRLLLVQVVSYVLLNALFIVLWAQNGGFFWPVFVIVGWGIGIASQAAHLFGPRASEEAIQREMDRLGRR